MVVITTTILHGRSPAPRLLVLVGKVTISAATERAIV
jgi:hypothetical protein